MKKLKFLFIALLTMAITFAAASCSKENQKENQDDQSLESFIIGTWRSELGDGAYQEVIFKKDKTFQVLYCEDGYVETYDGKYVVSGDVLTLNNYKDGKLDSSDAVEVKRIDKDRLILGELMYIRQ